MQSRKISYAAIISCCVLNATALAAGDPGVIILGCGMTTTVPTEPLPCPPCAPSPDQGINVASFSASGHSVPSSVAVGHSCAVAISDLMGNGFALVNVTPGAVGFGSGAGRGGTAFGTPQITYTLVKGRNPQ